MARPPHAMNPPVPPVPPMSAGRRGSDALAWRGGVALCALLAALNLLAGASGGLARLGLPVPAAAAGLHGAVMACGFFGTLIALERAVALRRPLGLVAPLAAGLGGAMAWAFAAGPAVPLAWAIAAGALVGLYLRAGFTRAWSLPLAVELAAGLCWLAGVAAWAAGSLAAGVTGWTAFLVLTIAAERRELTQMVRLPVLARYLFVAVVAVLVSAVGLAVAAAFGAGTAAAVPVPWWLGCALLAGWLLRWDLAPRKWGAPGWLGHTAQCLTVGYAWLAIGALLGLAGLAWPGGVTGLALHAVLLGFVFAMVFGHAPIILPALAGVRPAYSAWARPPLWLLSASLVLRGAALATGSARLLAAAGAGHGLAIGWFALAMLTAVVRGQRAGR